MLSGVWQYFSFKNLREGPPTRHNLDMGKAICFFVKKTCTNKVHVSIGIPHPLVHKYIYRPKVKFCLSFTYIPTFKHPTQKIILWNLITKLMFPDKTLIQWRLTRDESCFGNPHRRLHGHSHFVSDVVMSSDGQFALSGSWDKTLRLWDLST